MRRTKITVFSYTVVISLPLEQKSGLRWSKSLARFERCKYPTYCFVKIQMAALLLQINDKEIEEHVLVFVSKQGIAKHWLPYGHR